MQSSPIQKLTHKVLNRACRASGLYTLPQSDATLQRLLFRRICESPNDVRGQLGQDLLVDLLMQGQAGFFVEFGAADGKRISNTYFLETSRGWRGILAEPARGYHESLRLNRPHSQIDSRCVWSHSGKRIDFIETADPELSTIKDCVDSDLHSAARQQVVAQYSVETVSLLDLLSEHNCPKQFDYLSVDTEGTELQILKHFDFSRFRPHIVTVEHNYSPAAVEIDRIMVNHGFCRILDHLSWWDGWYVCSSFATGLAERVSEAFFRRFTKAEEPSIT